jgi:hypothetical protein
MASQPIKPCLDIVGGNSSN